MVKKARSQRRKNGRQDGNAGDDHDGDMEFLPEDHTVADSIITFDADFGTRNGRNLFGNVLGMDLSLCWID